MVLSSNDKRISRFALDDSVRIFNRAITGLSQYVFWYGKKDRPSVHRRDFADCLGEYYI